MAPSLVVGAWVRGWGLGLGRGCPLLRPHTPRPHLLPAPNEDAIGTAAVYTVPIWTHCLLHHSAGHGARARPGVAPAAHQQTLHYTLQEG